MLGCSCRGTCAGRSAWNSDTGTNPCQVLRPVGSQPLAPPSSPGNQHFRRGKGQYLPFPCVVGPRTWKENERKICAMTRESMPSSSSASPKDLTRILSAFPPVTNIALGLSSGGQGGKMCILVLENFKDFSSQWQGIFPGKAISFLGLVGSLIILK